MQPSQPAPPPPQEPQRYDFFLNPPPAPKKSKIPIPIPNVPGTKDPFIRKVIMIGGGGLLLIIIVAVLASLIFGGKNNSATLVTLAQQQNEMIRVATEAAPNISQQTAKNLDQDVGLSLTTSQEQLLAYLKNHGQKVGTKELALTQSTATDTQLTNAEAASNLDAVFTQIMQQQLQAYMQGIKQDYNASKNTALRQLLNTEYSVSVLLLNQANNTATALQSP
jgi:hypothetical protein